MPTLGTLGLALLAGLMGVAAYRNRRVRGALNVLLPVIAIAALSLGSAPSLNAQATDPNTTYAGSVNDAIQSVRAVVDAAGNVGVMGTRSVTCAATPVTLVSENLPNIDNAGAIFTGTLVVSRYVASGAAISADYIDTATGTPLTGAGATLSVTSNGTANLQVTGKTLSLWAGKLVRLRVVVDGYTMVTMIYVMV